MIELSRSDRRPIYVQIEEQFIGLLRAGALRSHASLPPAVELGGRLGISHLTVRHAYARLARQGHIYSIRGKGTFVAERNDSDALAMTVPSEFFRSPGNSGVYAAMADTLFRISQQNGRVLRLIVLSTPFAQQVSGELNAHDAETLRQTRMKGLFITGHRLPAAVMRELRHRGVRLVGFVEATPNCIIEDQQARFSLPLAYARSRGRKSIGMIYLNLGDHPGMKDRLLAAMSDAGFEADPARVVGVNSASMAGGQIAAEYLLNTQRKLDALVCYDDLLAHGMCMACVKRRVAVPDKTLLIAHANKEITPPFLVPVARFVVDIKTMVRQGYEKMCALLEGRRAVGVSVKHQPVLVPESASSIHSAWDEVVLNVG